VANIYRRDRALGDATASVRVDALGITRATGFPQVRAASADWRPLWLDGIRVGEREGE
jgi:hypothetical protein